MNESFISTAENTSKYTPEQQMERFRIASRIASGWAKELNPAVRSRLDNETLSILADKI